MVFAVKVSLDNDIWSLSTEKGANLCEQLKERIIPGTIVYPQKVRLISSKKLFSSSALFYCFSEGSILKIRFSLIIEWKIFINKSFHLV